MRNGQGGDASRMTRSSVTIQITPESKPSTPSWMGEAAAFAQVLTHTGILKAIQEQVRFTRARGCLITTSSISLRPHRFCRRAHRLWTVGRTNAPCVLRTTRSVCRAVHGSRCRETSCPIARPLLAFWPLSIRQVWRRSASFFKRICLRENRLLLLAVYATGREHRGWWSMWMERGKPPENLALPQTEALPAPHRR